MNAAGGMPDTQTYVPFTVSDGTITVSVSEGWAHNTPSGGATRFADKNNSGGGTSTHFLVAIVLAISATAGIAVRMACRAPFAALRGL
ncbi:hypothetical protein MHPYR_780015 [uncultured Mycobacterium sp.]|uniref:Uncharacterized protein n=1 Tax=uncultured Mycobacterium sp. TaxID=171292 RepID=A0A1Y5PL37_9MYCO|nr:hypothetical protein MHPYR_780015 [uncultured Mycobacterium sp.]